MESTKGFRCSGIAGRLRAAREKKNLSQSELSIRAGLDRKTCFQIERGSGQGNIGVVTLEKLARALQVSPAWLVFDEDDSQDRIAGLLQELVEVKKERLALAERRHDPDEDDSAWSMTEDDEEPEEIESEESEQSEDRAEPSCIWPHGYRPMGLVYDWLPPLGRHYAPVLEALGPSLPVQRRRWIGQCLASMIYLDQRDYQRKGARELRELLTYLVPARDHAIVELVMNDLDSDDPTCRGRMALSLIIDGGIPVTFRDLVSTRSRSLPRELYGALTNALEILENLIEASYAAEAELDEQARYLLPPAAGENIPRLGG